MLFAATLRDYFAKFGKVDQVQVMYNRETNKSRGFGFVTFESEETVESVLREKRMHEIDNKSVRAQLILLFMHAPRVLQAHFPLFFDEKVIVPFFRTTIFAALLAFTLFIALASVPHR